MKRGLLLATLALSIAASQAGAATWGAEAVFGSGGPTPIGGTAKVKDGVYTEESIGGAIPSRPSEGTVQVVSSHGGASASIENGLVKLDGFAPDGAATSGWVYDTLTNFKAKRGKDFSLGYILDFEVDPYEYPNMSDKPIAQLSLSIQGGGVSSGFSIPIYGCQYTNACSTSDVVRFPKGTQEIKIGFSMSALAEAAGLPLVHDYYAKLRMGLAEFCKIDGVFTVCPVGYDSASTKWQQNVPPLPVIPAAVPLPASALLLVGALSGLAAASRSRRMR